MSFKRKFYLRITLPVFFALLVALTAVIIFTVNYVFSLASMDRVAQGYIGNIGDLVLDKTVNHLEPAARLAALDAVLLDPRRVAGDYAAAFDTVTMKQLRIYPQTAQIYFGDSGGNFRMNTREQNGSIACQIITRLDDSEASKETIGRALKMPRATDKDRAEIARLISPFLATVTVMRDPEDGILGREKAKDYVYDPRLRPWYKAAAAAKTTVWTPAYLFSSSGKHFASGKPGVTVSSAVLNASGDSGVTGVVGVDIMLLELSDFINSLQIGKTGRAFIINSAGQVIALSNYKEVTVKNEKGVEQLANIVQTSDEAAVLSFKLLAGADGGGTGTLRFNKPRFTKFDAEGLRYIGYYLPIPEVSGLEWYVGIVVPEDDFIGDIRRNLYFSIIVCALSMIIVLLFSMRLSRSITGPLVSLTKEALYIREFNVDGRIDLKSRFRELDDMARAFISMKAGLRSFRKFVPADLVRRLVQSGEEAELGGRHETLSIYFSDIVGFTGITEKMTAEALIPHLGEYVSRQSMIIQEIGGTVDKYIGDAVMAFWNAPSPVENHALKACEAALAVQDDLAGQRVRWERLGRPPFRTRIGIETGEVMVGNMGSENRLNYTVIGDTVNQASRLESLGKYYKVSILIGEVAYSQAKEGIEARQLDRVILVGKTKAIRVYELQARKGGLNEALKRLDSLYSLGLKLYFARHFAKAEKAFNAALAEFPDDHPSRLMSARCRKFRTEPPPDDWTGAFAPDSK